MVNIVKNFNSVFRVNHGRTTVAGWRDDATDASQMELIFQFRPIRMAMDGGCGFLALKLNGPRGGDYGEYYDGEVQLGGSQYCCVCCVADDGGV